MSKVSEKKKRLGQWFTKEEAADSLVNLLLSYKDYDEDIDILEPAYGTGSFVKVLKERKFDNIDGCEIDEELIDEDISDGAQNFFTFPVEKKYKMIVSNPPFSKYNCPASFYQISGYSNEEPAPSSYLPESFLSKERVKRENVFLLKATHHLKDRDSSIGFIMPISFLTKGKNIPTREELYDEFSTIIIYQDDDIWFDYDIPCCFTIFCNTKEYNGKIVLKYDNNTIIEDKKLFVDGEPIPKTYFYKVNSNLKGEKLEEFLKDKSVSYETSYDENNISAKNIQEHTEIPKGKDVKKYRLAVCRVGNTSVGRAGLVNIEEDILNEMFYLFEFKDEYKSDKAVKEMVCKKINDNIDHFRRITDRVGAKSIRKEQVLNFKI